MKHDVALLQYISSQNPGWFNEKNREFFNDVQYWAYHSKSGDPYLVRSTYAFTDMFGGPKTLHYRINIIGDNNQTIVMNRLLNRRNKPPFQIESLIDDEFATLAEVESWLLEH